MTLHALRILEEEGTRMRSSEVSLTLPNQIALYLLNEKRETLDAIESKYQIRIRILGNDSINPNEIEIERTKAKNSNLNSPKQDKEEETREKSEEKLPKRKRPRRRRRRKNDVEEDITSTELKPDDTERGPEPGNDIEKPDEEKSGRRRRGKRGGRRRRVQTAVKPLDTNSNFENDFDNASSIKEASNKTEEQSVSASDDSITKPSEVSAEMGSDVKAPDKPAKRGWWQRILE